MLERKSTENYFIPRTVSSTNRVLLTMMRNIMKRLMIFAVRLVPGSSKVRNTLLGKVKGKGQNEASRKGEKEKEK